MGVNDPQILAMQKVGMTEEEIADVLKCDKEIDRGAKLFELERIYKRGQKKQDELTELTPPSKQCENARKMLTNEN